MLALALVAVLTAEAPADIVRTKDGATRVGRILSETQAGYLFRDETGTTSVVRFDEIDDLQRGSDVPRASTQQQLRPTAALLDEQQRLETAARLRSEIRELRRELDESDLAPPIVKLALGATAGALAIIMFASGDGRPNNGAQMTTAAAAGIVSVVLLIWGGAQFGLRMRERARIPEEIRDREQQLLVLGERPPAN